MRTAAWSKQTHHRPFHDQQTRFRRFGESLRHLSSQFRSGKILNGHLRWNMASRPQRQIWVKPKHETPLRERCLEHARTHSHVGGAARRSCALVGIFSPLGADNRPRHVQQWIAGRRQHGGWCPQVSTMPRLSCDVSQPSRQLGYGLLWVATTNADATRFLHQKLPLMHLGVA